MTRVFFHEDYKQKRKHFNAYIYISIKSYIFIQGFPNLPISDVMVIELYFE